MNLKNAVNFCIFDTGNVTVGAEGSSSTVLTSHNHNQKWNGFYIFPSDHSSNPDDDGQGKRVLHME